MPRRGPVPSVAADQREAGESRPTIQAVGRARPRPSPTIRFLPATRPRRPRSGSSGSGSKFAWGSPVIVWWVREARILHRHVVSNQSESPRRPTSLPPEFGEIGPVSRSSHPGCCSIASCFAFPSRRGVAESLQNVSLAGRPFCVQLQGPATRLVPSLAPKSPPADHRETD